MRGSVSPALNSKMLSGMGDPLKFWRYLNKTFGDNTIDDQGIGRAFIRIISRRMKHEARFNEYILEFERECKIVRLSENLRLGLLLSNGDDELHITILPERLWAARDRCR